MALNLLSKKTYLILIAISIILSLSIFSENSKKILIIGDSISAGYGIPLHDHWVHILQQDLDSKGQNIQLINASVSGDTSGGGLSRIGKLLKDYSPDYILLELGGNDGLRGYAIDKIKKNIEDICQIAIQENIPVWIMQIKLPPNYGFRYTEAFKNIYIEIAKKKQITLIPFILDKIALDAEFMQPDGIHPNKKSQPKIAKIMYESIQLLINK